MGKLTECIRIYLPISCLKQYFQYFPYCTYSSGEQGRKYQFSEKSNQIKNQIKSLLLSHHHSTSALVSEILMSVLQTVQKTTIYIWTVHIYRLYRRQCAKYTYIYSVHIVYYKDILNYQLHIIHRMGTSTLCTLSIHYVVYT